MGITLGKDKSPSRRGTGCIPFIVGEEGGDQERRCEDNLSEYEVSPGVISGETSIDA